MVKSQGVVIQMKATKLSFSVMLFILLYKKVLTFDTVDSNVGPFR